MSTLYALTHLVHSLLRVHFLSGLLNPTPISELTSHYSTVFGINHRSPLEPLSHFSVASGALLPDIMHDVLEGALPLEIKHMLKV